MAKKSDLALIRITKETKIKLENLSIKHRLKQITVLEYLLSGKINISELQ